MTPTFSILITTKNRKDDLLFTLNSIKELIERNDVECIVCDDGSTDGTSDVVKTQFPEVHLITNEVSKGYMVNRNKMLNMTKVDYAISLDDDAHFLSKGSLEEIKNYFAQNPKCGVIACRIFWGKDNPKSIETTDMSQRVAGFVGCGHVWNMKAWKNIPDYPEWFVFYGEEEFAAYQLFKKGWEVHYNSNILVHHRVSIKSRKKDKDYSVRQRRSLRSGWYLYFMFYPWKMIPKKLLYTFYIQIKNKTFKGDWKATLAIFQAMGDVIINFPKLMRQSNRFSQKEMENYLNLPETKLYWKPEDI